MTAWLGVVTAGLLLSGPAWAATITVNTSNPPVPDGLCSFGEAVWNANEGSKTFDCASGDPGLDIIVMPHDQTFTFSIPRFQPSPGWNFSFPITDDLIVLGNGSTVQPSDEAEDPFFVEVKDSIHLEIHDLNLRKWRVAVRFVGSTRPTLSLRNCRFVENFYGVSWGEGQEVAQSLIAVSQPIAQG